MAVTRVIIYLLVISTSFSLFPGPCNGSSLKVCGFDQIYQLGDSYSDTGNFIRENPFSTISRLPYGETFFHKATGRCSDGRLIIDFIATAAGLPFLNPYKNYNADFRHGVNFAVAGATALPAEALAENNITSTKTNRSLNVQLDWMSAHFDSICDTGDCAEKLKDSLFIVGEIVGNDIFLALSQGKSIEEVKSLVPSIVQAIQNAARRVINYGAVRVVVPGIFPIGCLPICLTGFQSNDSTAYDENKCLKHLNELSKFYNEQLQQAIAGLNKEFKNAVITYGDYYNAFEWLLENADYLGFDSSTVQIACCGIGGDYNFNPKRLCGTLGVPVCQDPNKFVSWDGVHFTQEAYKHISEWIMDDLLPKLQCSL